MTSTRAKAEETGRPNRPSLPHLLEEDFALIIEGQNHLRTKQVFEKSACCLKRGNSSMEVISSYWHSIEFQVLCCIHTGWK